MNRILVRAPNWIGDQILAYPFFRHLRMKYPQAWITVVCTEWVRDIQFKGLIDEVRILPRTRQDSFWMAAKTLLRFSAEIKAAGPWDLGITLPNSFGSALLLKLAGADLRRGYSADGRGFLLNQVIPFDRGTDFHRSRAYLRLLSPEGLPNYEADQYWIKGPERDFDPYAHWPEVVPIEPPFDPYFVIAPGSNADSRRWSIQHFETFIEIMISRYRMKAVVVGGRAEKELAKELLRRGVPIEDYTARGWVAAHWKLFRGASFTVCNDSGLAHVAALCGSRVQIVWGAGDPARTLPIGPGPVRMKSNPVPCWPCERNQCRFQDSRLNQCLQGITGEVIFEEVENGFLMG
ncbi:MAG: glycosyltransferase family 9 protein [Bdellovibrionales bacterium]|nr:glycosyltransferase family 9 protein [Bdellovibrionales bacterium]